MNDSFTFGSEVDDIFASKSDTEGNTDFLNLIMNTETDESCDDEFDPQKTDNRAEKEADIEKTSTSSDEEVSIDLAGVVAPEEPPSEEKVTDELFGTSSSELESFVAFPSQQTAQNTSVGTTIEEFISKQSATDESPKTENKEESMITLNDFFNDDINVGNSQEAKQRRNNNPLGDGLVSDEPKASAGLDDNPFGDDLFSDKPKTAAGLDDNPFGDDLFCDKPKASAGLDDNPFGDDLFSDGPKASAGLDDNPFAEKKKEGNSETPFPSLDDNPLW